MNYLQDLALETIREWLKSSARTISHRQWELVTKALNKCTLPLFVKLIFATVARYEHRHFLIFGSVISRRVSFSFSTPNAITDVVAWAKKRQRSSGTAKPGDNKALQNVGLNCADIISVFLCCFFLFLSNLRKKRLFFSDGSRTPVRKRRFSSNQCRRASMHYCRERKDSTVRFTITFRYNYLSTRVSGVK